MLTAALNQASYQSLVYNITSIKHVEIEEVSRDGKAKTYTNKSCRDNNRQDSSLHTFSLLRLTF